jgi:acetylornithine deacetylase
MPFACSNERRARELLGDRVTAYGPLDFWTEAALHEAAGVPAVVVGPGEIHRAHAPDEWVSIEDLAWAQGLFESVL